MMTLQLRYRQLQVIRSSIKLAPGPASHIVVGRLNRGFNFHDPAFAETATDFQGNYDRYHT